MKKLDRLAQALALFRRAWPHRPLAVEACVALLSAQLRLTLFGLKAQGLHGLQPPPASPVIASTRRQAETEWREARAIAWALSRAAAHLPFEYLCLARALAAKSMLRRRRIPYILHVGVARDAGGFEAHAWLEAAGVEVTGYPVDAKFREIGFLADGGAVSPA